MRGHLTSPAIAIASLAALIATDAFGQAGPAAPIGSAVRIVNKVTAADVGVPRPLAAGDNVNQDETIEVEQNSIGELRLNDETKLALGPGAKLRLDKFVYDPNKTTGTIAVDLTKGAFRFITGNARKPSYLIRSPNASISVRGTIFDVYVDATGNMWILLHEGSLEVCNSRGQCSALDQNCGLVRVGSNGDLSGAAIWPRQPAVQEINFDNAFPFVVRPPQIDPLPRFTRAAIEAGTCPSDEIKPPKTRRAEVETPLEPTKLVPLRHQFRLPRLQVLNRKMFRRRPRCLSARRRRPKLLPPENPRPCGHTLLLPQHRRKASLRKATTCRHPLSRAQ